VDDAGIEGLYYVSYPKIMTLEVFALASEDHDHRGLRSGDRRAESLVTGEIQSAGRRRSRASLAWWAVGSEGVRVEVEVVPARGAGRER
jgi:hypothetical protein